MLIAFLAAFYYAVENSYFEKDNLQTHIDSGQCVAKFESLATHQDKNFYITETKGLKNYHIWRDGRVIKIDYPEFEKLRDYYDYK